MTLYGPAVRVCQAVPWISELAVRVPCEGFSWSRVSGRKPPGHPFNRCHMLARWHYEALPAPRGHRDGAGADDYTESSDLCSSHIFSHGLMSSSVEMRRWNKWYAENRDKLTEQGRTQS